MIRTAAKPTEKPDASDGVDPDFKAAMDEYEAFIDEYVTFIKKYEEEGKPVSMLADYTKMMTQYSNLPRQWLSMKVKSFPMPMRHISFRLTPVYRQNC